MIRVYLSVFSDSEDSKEWATLNLREFKNHKAFNYTMKRYKRLAIYMGNGLLNIDNNPIESSIRAIALDRKNYMFSGSHDGAQRSVMLYSLMGTCKLHSINPMIWMVNVLRKINNHPAAEI